MTKENDLERFAICMGLLDQIFGGETSSKKVSIYFEILNDYPIEQIEKAIKYIIKSRNTASFPKPAEIIQAIEGSVSDKTLQAIKAVKEMMVKVGYMQSVKFDDPAIMATLQDMGTWWDLCREWDDWKEKDFVKRYEHYLRFPDFETLIYLVGWSEAENNRKNLTDWIEPPMLMETKTLQISQPKTPLLEEKRDDNAV